MSGLVRWAGLAALALVAVLTLGTVGALALRAEPGRGLGPAEWAALRFTLWQALLSAGLSCLLAVPAARALARRRFPGRAVLVALLGAPFLLPAIVAVFGIVAIWGRAGLVSRGLEALGGPGLDVYGLVGRGAGARVLQRGAGGAAAASGVAGDPGGELPAGGAARLRAARRVPADRAADAPERAARGVRAGLPALHDELRGGADPRRRAAGDDGGAGDLPGAALRLRPRAGGAAGADPVRPLRRGGAGSAPAVGRRRASRPGPAAPSSAGTPTGPGCGRRTPRC